LSETGRVCHDDVGIAAASTHPAGSSVTAPVAAGAPGTTGRILSASNCDRGGTPDAAGTATPVRDATISTVSADCKAGAADSGAACPADAGPGSAGSTAAAVAANSATGTCVGAATDVCGGGTTFTAVTTGAECTASRATTSAGTGTCPVCADTAAGAAVSTAAIAGATRPAVSA
jgi:hypothetical protein